MTGEEIRQRNLAAMGNALGTQYTLLRNELVTLYWTWKEFIALFGTNPKRIERLNKAAPGFFRMLQTQQFESNMIHLARLTDSPKSMGSLNLTIRNLPDLITDPVLNARVSDLVKEAKTKTDFCREWRNKHLAHRDLLAAIGDPRAVPLPSVPINQFFEALRSLANLLNAIEGFYFQSLCSFEDVISYQGASSLLWILGFGIMAKERMQDELAKGNYNVARPEDV